MENAIVPQDVTKRLDDVPSYVWTHLVCRSVSAHRSASDPALPGHLAW